MKNLNIRCRAGLFLRGLLLAAALAVLCCGCGSRVPGEVTTETVTEQSTKEEETETASGETESSSGEETTETQSEEPVPEDVPAAEAAAQIKEALPLLGRYDYEAPIALGTRDETIDIKIGFDPRDLGMTEFTQIAAVYQDREGAARIGTHFLWDKESGEIRITPALYGDGLIALEGVPGDWKEKYEHGERAFFQKEQLSDWGNLTRMYFIRYVDLETGKTLERPVMQVVYPYAEYGMPDDVRYVTDEEKTVFSAKAESGAPKDYVLLAIKKDAEWGFANEGKVVASASTPGGRVEIELPREQIEESQEYALIGIGESGTTLLSEPVPGKALLAGEPQADDVWEQSEVWSKTPESFAADTVKNVAQVSPLERFLEMHLLNRAECADLAYFPEAADPGFLTVACRNCRLRHPEVTFLYGRVDQKLRISYEEKP